MKSRLSVATIIFATLLFIGFETSTSQRSSVAIATTGAAKPQDRPSPKTGTCYKCLESELKCVKTNDKGDCVKWKYVCKQWQSYPC